MKFSSIYRSLHKPVDNTSLVIFRIAFGLLLAVESIGAIFTGWVKRVFVDPQFTFSFIGFEWLQPLPGYGMYYYYALMGICGLLVMTGLFYRYSLGLFTLLWWGCYLMQKTSYNNHYYLLILLCLLMMLVPANRNASLDAKFHYVKATTSCPAWCIDIFKWQLLIVYTYAALAKLYPGWLEGEFISLSFASKENYLLIGKLLQKQWIQKLVIIGGVVYDLTIIPVMYWDRSRLFGFYVSVVFHLFNSIVFGIGIFPYLMLASLVLFFPTTSWRPKIPGYLKAPENQPNTTHWALTPFLIIYFVIQLWLPVRHYFIPGDVFVTEEGHRMAWRMMLRTKWGSVKYKLVDKESGKSWVVFPGEYLSPKQTRKIAGHPDLIWQFSRFLEKEYSNQGVNSLEVYAIAETYLNSNKIDDLIDPEVDLLSVEWNRFGHNSWILY